MSKSQTQSLVKYRYITVKSCGLIEGCNDTGIIVIQCITCIPVCG